MAYEVTLSSSTAATLTLADTQYTYTFGGRQRNTVFQCNDASVAWRWSFTAGVVAAGGGHDVPAGGSIIQEAAPVAGTVLYLASSSAGAVIVETHETEYAP